MKRIVLITGGTTGIGAVTAKTFKEKGYQVVVNFAFGDEAAAEFNKQTGIPIYKWDVTDADACMDGVKKVIAECGAVDVLVNNAGITRDHTIQKMPVADWHSVINTDLGSCFNMARAVIDSMRAKKFGRIISISSISGMAGQFGQTNYAAAKAGILGFTKALALETADKGITVNAVAPGFTKTSMLNTIPNNVLEALITRIPVKRLGKPEDIARAVLFLAADDADFITGETLAVNGGLYMG
ncbi:MAG: acetoacetyl-CoA reductase [Gammaproteobacteria bacterium]|nr:acetoacetyl-CoA reductase [Gammaproteobacteria bacterium]